MIRTGSAKLKKEREHVKSREFFIYHIFSPLSDHVICVCVYVCVCVCVCDIHIHFNVQTS